jgi:hypothetical protein
VVRVTVPDGDFAPESYQQVIPVEVKIVGKSNDYAPEFGGCSYFIVPLAGVAAGLPLQVLDRRPERKQAWIRNLDTANYVVIAETSAKLQQGIPQGFIIPPGQVERIESKQGYWAVVMPAGTGLAGVVTSSPAAIQPAVPATGVAVQNTNQFPVQVVISPNGATITNVTVNGLTVGTTAGTYTVPANGTISIAYTVATPTWVWTNTTVITPAPVILAVRDEAWAVEEV